jgi:5-formyltetrahydrofolate cyclo-ligase
VTIEFKIPNGNMRINAETFFKEAPRMKIRKMLKCFQDSEPAAEDVHKIKDWLQDKVDSERRRKKDFSVKFSHEKDQLPIFEKYREHLKNFGIDKEKLNRAEKDDRNCKLRMRTALSGMNEAEKLAERYKSILEDACKILG